MLLGLSLSLTDATGAAFEGVVRPPSHPALPNRCIMGDEEGVRWWLMGGTGTGGRGGGGGRPSVAWLQAFFGSSVPVESVTAARSTGSLGHCSLAAGPTAAGRDNKGDL